MPRIGRGRTGRLRRGSIEADDNSSKTAPPALPRPDNAARAFGFLLRPSPANLGERGVDPLDARSRIQRTSSRARRNLLVSRVGRAEWRLNCAGMTRPSFGRTPPASCPRVRSAKAQRSAIGKNEMAAHGIEWVESDPIERAQFAAFLFASSAGHFAPSISSCDCGLVVAAHY